LALSIHILHAQDAEVLKSESIVEKIRPTLMNIFGEQWTVKILGAAPEIKVAQAVVVFPSLPKIIQDARSTAVYNKKADSVILKPAQEEKYFYAYVTEIFEATRQTRPNDEELSKLMNIISQGASREGIYHQLVLDATYGALENTDKPLKANAIDFANYFYERYMGKKVAKENLKGMNIYSLKRLIADTALDEIDAFGEKRDELERWYAVMSADLAQRFPQLWSSKLRKDNSALHHKNWASKVPLQHIKSETIIKLHTAFNSLM